MGNIEELKRDFLSLIQKTTGLLAIIITDREGVPLFTVSSEILRDVSLRPALMSSFAMGSEQAGKLGIGSCHTMTCQYQNFQIVHFNKDKLVVALIASNKASTGMLLALENEFDVICSELRQCLD